MVASHSLVHVLCCGVVHTFASIPCMGLAALFLFFYLEVAMSGSSFCSWGNGTGSTLAWFVLGLLHQQQRQQQTLAVIVGCVCCGAVHLCIALPLGQYSWNTGGLVMDHCHWLNMNSGTLHSSTHPKWQIGGQIQWWIGPGCCSIHAWWLHAWLASMYCLLLPDIMNGRDDALCGWDVVVPSS
jgi:hypothetical protein